MESNTILNRTLKLYKFKPLLLGIRNKYTHIKNKFKVFLVARMVNNLPAIQETRVWSWVGKIPWKREWLPAPIFFPGEFHGQRSLAGYNPWVRKELDMTERLRLALHFSSVQLLSCVLLFVTPWTAASCPLPTARLPCPLSTARACSNSSPSSSLWCYSTISSCHPLLLLPSMFPSIMVFSNESVLRSRWPEYWSFSFSISPSNEYSGLLSFRIH